MLIFVWIGELVVLIVLHTYGLNVETRPKFFLKNVFEVRDAFANLLGKVLNLKTKKKNLLKS